MRKKDFYKIKKSTLFWVVLGIIFVGWLLWTIEDVGENLIPSDNAKEYTDNFLNISETHWGHMPLTYKFENEGLCFDWQPNLFRSAFNNITLETSGVVSFMETYEEPDISIYCKPSNTNTRTGEGTIADALPIMHPDNENLVIKGEINLYGQGKICNTGYPALEVHEILHLFDIPHNPLTDSVMQAYSVGASNKCKVTKIDQEYISCLRYIYSNGQIDGNCSFPNVLYEYEENVESQCEEGLYNVKGTNWCCPEPNMIIDEDGYCNYP